MHVLVADADGFDATRALARRLAEVLVASAPDVLTLEGRRGARGRRPYLDVQRNVYRQHVIAPYSLRALPGAPVAVPLTWDEATASSYDPRRVTIGGWAETSQPARRSGSVRRSGPASSVFPAPPRVSKKRNSSTGTGKTSVELRSAATSLIVPSNRSCIAAG